MIEYWYYAHYLQPLCQVACEECLSTRLTVENACEVLIQLITCHMILHLICMMISSLYLQVLVLADLHNTVQLKLHVLKFINDRRVAEARFYPLWKISDRSAGNVDRRVASNASRAFSFGG